MLPYFGKYSTTAIVLTILACFCFACLTIGCCCVCISNHRKCCSCCKSDAGNVEEVIGMDEIQQQQQQQEQQQEQQQGERQQYEQVLARVMREMLEENRREGGANQVEEGEGGVEQKRIGSFAARRNTLDLSLDIPPRPRSGAFYVPQRRQERVGEELREINERWGFPEVKKE